MSESTASALDGEAYISLATFRKTGKAVETPVWFARDGALLFVFTEAKAGKCKRLRNNPRVRVAACNVSGKIHGAPFEGSARVVDPSEEAAAYVTLKRKYGWQMRLLDIVSTVSGRIHGRAVIEISLDG